MIKQVIKTMNTEFIEACCIISIFFCPVQALCNLIPEVSHFDINTKK